MPGIVSKVEEGSVERYPSQTIQMMSPSQLAVGGTPIVDKVERQQPFLLDDVPTHA
jgi:hypothetical protein